MVYIKALLRSMDDQQGEGSYWGSHPKTCNLTAFVPTHPAISPVFLTLQQALEWFGYISIR